MRKPSMADLSSTTTMQGLRVAIDRVDDALLDLVERRVALTSDMAALKADAGDALLNLSTPPTAIFAGSDEMAAGVLMAAHRRGLAIPGDVAIAGFGDDALAGYVWPPLTTVRQPVRELAWQAADLLLGKAEPDALREVPHALVVRAST